MISEPGPRAGRREWIGLGIIALPCLLYSMDLTVLNLAVPRLSADLRPTSAQLLWIVDIYGFVLAGLLIPMGALGDRIGRRKVLLIGGALFGAASVLAAFSRSAEMLIGARAILGVAGATIAPSTLSLIRNMFLDARQRTTAISVWISSFSVGGSIGPLIGGALLNHFWWGSVFLVGVPVMLLLLVLGPVFLSEFRNVNAARIDLLSAIESLAAVLLVIYGVKRFAEGTGGSESVVSIAVGLAVGALFVRRQTRLAEPLIDLRLFRLPSFSAALAAYTIGTFAGFGFLFFISQFLQGVRDLSPLAAGICLMPISLSFIVGSFLSPALARRFGPAALMGGGMIVAVLGFLLLARIGTDSGIAIVVTASVLYSLGLAPLFTLTTDMIVGAAPPERAGAAAALSETGSELGGALGIALLGSIGAAAYRSAMASSIPFGISTDASRIARGTLGGAIAAAENLQSETAATLVRAAQSAFCHSLNVTALSAAVILAISAILITPRLRARASSEPS
jgi:MFS transporter, DHA2 family, multidrug resistance protein